jgi:hypothetical protein
MGPSNSRECLAELRGRTIVGLYRHESGTDVPGARYGWALILDDGTALVFVENGSFWREPKRNVRLVVNDLKKRLSNVSPNLRGHRHRARATGSR